MEKSKLRVALDGPSGAGKSTVARAAAKKLGYLYVDTGALYRACGLFARERGVPLSDPSGLPPLLPSLSLRLTYEEGEQRVLMNGKDVGDRIRTPEVSLYASAVSRLPEVRAFLLDIQRTMAAAGGVVMDGRDIGTVIMPDAEIKVFMTAAPEERARRRHRELTEKGQSVSYEAVLSDILERDKADSERETAPLRPAPDAVFFQNDGLSVEECADFIAGLARAWEDGNREKEAPPTPVSREADA